MSIIKDRAEYLVGIFPYIRIKKIMSAINQIFLVIILILMECQSAETLNLFKSNGFNLIEKKGHHPYSFLLLFF